MSAVASHTDVDVEMSLSWVDVCALDDIIPDTGVCALVAERQVAVFRMLADDRVYAIDNYDPNSCANVLSRGIVGDMLGQPVVASPIYKQHFSLVSGACLDVPETSVRAYPTRVQHGRVYVGIGDA